MQPIRSLSSPSWRIGSAMAKSFSPAFDRHGRACKITSGESSYVKSFRSTTCTHSGGAPLSGRTLQALPKNQARVPGHRTGPRRIVEHARRYAAPRRGCSRSRPCVLVRAFSEHPPGTTGTCVRGANRRCAAASARCLPARWGDWKNRLELWPTDLSLPQSDLWRWNRPPRHVARA
jgi:hypothetical protein